MLYSLIVFGRRFPVTRSLNQLRSTTLYVISLETIPVAIASMPPKMGVSDTMTERNATAAKTTPSQQSWRPNTQ
jgi:hypothetical protein